MKSQLIKKPAKRKPSNTVSAAVKAMANAALPILSPPKHLTLTKEAMKFWPAIITARARDEWNDVELVVAAQLARCQADIEQEEIALQGEGKVIENARGTPVMNPRASIIEQHSRRQMALMRTLRMGGRIAGNADDMVKGRMAERKARQTQVELSAEEQEDEELLAHG